MKLKGSKSLCYCLFAVACAVSVYSQTARLDRGIVVDANRAVIPGANISVTNEGGQVFKAVTTANGTFRIPALSNGIYTGTVSSSGFKTVVVDNVKGDVDMPASVNVVLEVGSIDETVTIDRGAEVLQTETATVGSDSSIIRRIQLTDAKQIEFRAEAFNLFNNVNFANPISNLNAVTQPAERLMEPRVKSYQDAPGISERSSRQATTLE